jgi:hypothetical protein
VFGPPLKPNRDIDKKTAILCHFFATGMTISQIVPPGIIYGELLEWLELLTIRATLAAGLANPGSRDDELVEARLA